MSGCTSHSYSCRQVATQRARPAHLATVQETELREETAQRVHDIHERTATQGHCGVHAQRVGTNQPDAWQKGRLGKRSSSAVMTFQVELSRNSWLVITIACRNGCHTLTHFLRVAPRFESFMSCPLVTCASNCTACPHSKRSTDLTTLSPFARLIQSTLVALCFVSSHLPSSASVEREASKSHYFVRFPSFHRLSLKIILSQCEHVTSHTHSTLRGHCSETMRTPRDADSR